ncbi:hypothetical protein [Streptomyces sp. NPDC001380]|uniref:hypothetical protein n=1 Tax=Streptomyces sp. NPDC001380 TaxID=3364566 RepID=UPI0036B9CEFF
MSGFTRDTTHYGDRLVYEALRTKWSRYHARCGCGQDWVAAHAVPAGFTVVREGSGFVALVGPELTEGVDEERLTTNALWQAVTGEPGEQSWYETVRVIDRSPEAKAAERAHWEQVRAQSKARAAAAKTEPATDPQRRYLSSLAEQAGRARFVEAYTAAAAKADLPAPKPRERTETMIRRLTKAAARALISDLAGSK